MVAKQLAWLAALLVATPILHVACGGRSSTDDDGTGSANAGAAGTGGSIGTGGSTTGRGGGAATTGTGGSGGSGGTGGGIVDSGAPDGRLSCGTVVNGCAANPQGNTVCDLANNRCVQCLADPDCSGQTTNRTCDTRLTGNGNNRLPTDRCVQCIDNTQCAAGGTCSMNTCIGGSCSTDRDCSPDGGGRTPHCEPTTKTCAQCGADVHCTSPMAPACGPAGTCVRCTIDAHCATTMTPYCSLTNTCVQCFSDDQCTPPATCNTRGSCSGGGGGMDGGGRGGDGGGTPPTSDSGGGTPPTPDSGGGGGG